MTETKDPPFAAQWPHGVATIEVQERLRERLADPYLTDRDRWIPRQFTRFLSGLAPEPDPREPDTGR